jgi:CPA1 family monovalent cation:H+ antiporter
MEGWLSLEILIQLLVAVLVLMAAARRFLVPYPIFLVLGGLGLSLLPRVPVIHLDPDLVFLIFLPPLLWAAAYFTSLRDFRANLRPILLLAVVLVAVTTVAVAAIARAVVPGMGWPVALALGAIVSPPDAVAATAIARRLRIPHRLVTILEGESLVNDAAALVLYRVAIAAAVTGTFAPGTVLPQFVLAAAGGVAVGLLVGAATRWALRHTDDSLASVAITLLAPYMAWVAGERLHVSAVLACVTGGLYVRQALSELAAPAMRLQARAVWDVLLFVLNGVIFVLIGLQLGAIRESGLPSSLGHLVLQGALVSAAAIGIRLLWVPLGVAIPRLLSPALRRRDPFPPWSHVLVLAWTGMRGIVSLAAALALPLTTASGAPFPFRNEVILLTFAVILATLVIQGLSLTPLIRALDMGEDNLLELEEARARETAARAGLARLDDLTREPWVPREGVDRLRATYTQRARQASPIDPGDGDASARLQAALRRLRHETLTAERRAVIALRDQGAISDDVLHRIEQELDVEALRIGLGEVRMDADR